MVTVKLESMMYNQLLKEPYQAGKAEPVRKQLGFIGEIICKQRKLPGEKVPDVLHLGEEELLRIAERANKILVDYPIKLVYEVKKDNKIIFKLIHTVNKQAIKEIPFDKITELIDVIWQLAGLFVNVKA